MYNILKNCDLIHLNQTIFMRQYQNKKLPPSFNNFFQTLELSEQKSRDDDYNFKMKKLNNYNNLLFYPTVQLIRNWNRNNILIKSEADISELKNYFTIVKTNTYEEECIKLKCYVCDRDRN
jgi:hypothetical protein